jgi:transcriptional regulator with GAF, ATPase, and Fis domain
MSQNIFCWCHFYKIQSLVLEKQIRELFLREKIELSKSCTLTSEDTGLIFFNEEADPDELHAFLKEFVIGKAEKKLVVVGCIDTALYRKYAWKIFDAGPFDFYTWSSETALIIKAKLERCEKIRILLRSSFVRNYLVGKSARWRLLLWDLINIAMHTNFPVLIIGDSGTGKEQLARLIHHFDLRENKRSLALLDCTTIVPELSGSELFGHEKGAFTGAISSREGALALAHQGTLFMDELGEIPLKLQAELLRVIQEGVYKKVGSNNWQSTSFRLVAATNRDLCQEVKQGRFRLDLYHRIAGYVCHVPSLAERREDIPLLVTHFLKSQLKTPGLPSLDEALMDYLCYREYEGNVRELQQLVSRIAGNYIGVGPITLNELPVSDRNTRSVEDPGRSFELFISNAVQEGLGLKEIKELAASAAIDFVIKKENGNLQRAADRLKVTDRALQLRRKQTMEIHSDS